MKPTTIASTCVHRGRIVEVCTEKIRYPSGREYELDLVRHPGGAAVVAVDRDLRVCLVKQYRPGVTDFLWEIPAGKLDAREAPQICAIRELAEETGVAAKNWSSLGIFIPAPGIFTEIIHLYLAQDLQIGTAHPDADEDLELQWIPLVQAIDKVMSGEWSDGKTVVGLMRAQHHVK